MNHINLLKKAYIIISIGFVVSLFFHPYPGSFIIKSLPVLIMACLSFSCLKGAIKWLMISGFIFSGAGDIFLDLSREKFFIQGLASFAAAQLLYAIAFTCDMNINVKKFPFVMIIIMFTGVMTVFLIPELGELFLPVIVYIALISIMGICSALVKHPLTTVYAGAFIFIISDSIIAVNKFLFSFPYSTVLIIALYFIAQYKIGTGMINQAE